MENKKYNFGEKEKEYDSVLGEIPVWQSPKYITSKEKAIEMIESKKYDLNESDFWILMNKTKNGKMAYTGLIISHNGCLKINDKLENKVIPNNFTLDKEGYNNSLVYTYVDEDTYEVGEYSQANCKNGYPYAMAFKRCFDRVVLKKSKLAFSGIYSEVEADEFKEHQEEQQEEQEDYKQQLEEYINSNNLDKKEVCTKYGLTGKSTQIDFKSALVQLKVEQKNAS